MNDLSAELGLLKRQVRDRIRQGTEIHCGSLVPAREIDARLRRTCSIARGDGRGARQPGSGGCARQPGCSVTPLRRIVFSDPRSTRFDIRQTAAAITA